MRGESRVNKDSPARMATRENVAPKAAEVNRYDQMINVQLTTMMDVAVRYQWIKHQGPVIRMMVSSNPRLGLLP